MRARHLCALLALAPAAGAAEGELVSVSAGANGAKRMLYRIGPFTVKPGQNEIGNQVFAQKPKVDGWITRIRPDLTYTDGSVPGVDVIHLHHGVWLNLARQDSTWPGLPERFFAAGEEKTIVRFPNGYGYRYRASDRWLLNHMIHNLTPVPTEVYMVYEIDFIPKSSPRARGIEPVRMIWMDVENYKAYPVFDVEKGDGSRGRYTYPDDAPRAYAGRGRPNEWVVDRDGVLVSTVGHLHPGGLYTDLYVRRRGAAIRRASCAARSTAPARRRCRRNAPRGRGHTAHLFRSKARYFEPAGAVSWDVATTAAPRDWRVKLRKGDVLSTSATYDAGRAAWAESMGVMFTYMADTGPGRNPFKRRVDFPGRPTHGHLAENDNHGGGAAGLPNPVRLGDGMTASGPVGILDFRFTLGDLSLPGAGGRPPVVPRGQSITFRNADDPPRLPLDHLLQAALQPGDGNRLPDRRRPGAVRVRHARVGGAADDRPARVADPAKPRHGHLHLLLPDPSVHAGRLPREVSDPRGAGGVPPAVTLRPAMAEREGKSTAAAAAEQVRAIVEAAEQTAASLEAAAREDAARIRAEAEGVAAGTRDAAARIADRADELERRLDELADGVRAEVAGLKDELAALRAGSAAPAAAGPAQDVDPTIAETEAIAAREPDRRGGRCRGAAARSSPPPPTPAPPAARGARFSGHPRGRPGPRAQDGARRHPTGGDRPLPARELRARRPGRPARRGLRQGRRLSLSRPARPARSGCRPRRGRRPRPAPTAWSAAWSPVALPPAPRDRRPPRRPR